ncbi:MAG: FlgD immunoglobulin-like domain containing protein [Candidatus Cloacimonadota bacterium]|nr:FlgD immunoglobulin-like domain containing protein [Candidatus Cloacimonadota bacterium]
MNCSLTESLDEKVTISCISKDENKQTKVIICNSNMDEIRLVADEFMNAGEHLIEWDKKDESGDLVPDGFYYLKIVNGNYNSKPRLIII